MPHCWIEREVKQPNTYEECDDTIIMSHYESNPKIYYTKLEGYTEQKELWVLEATCSQCCTYNHFTSIKYAYSEENIMEEVIDLFRDCTNKVSKKDIEHMKAVLLSGESYEVPEELLSEDHESCNYDFKIYSLKI
jgi:hypothetical protein